MTLWELRGINHVGLAPKDPAKTKWFLGQVMGLPCLGEELVKSQETLTIMYRHKDPVHKSPSEGERLEVLVPMMVSADNAASKPSGPIARFLEKKGSGIHHIALTVSGLEQLLIHLKTHNIKMIDEVPRDGAHNTRIAFVHPDATGGLLVELVEEVPPSLSIKA